MKRRHSLCKTKHFVRVYKAVAKCSCELTHVRLCPSASAFARNSAPPTRQISVKFHVWAFLLTFLYTFRFWLNWAKSDLPSRSMYSYCDIVPRSVCVVEAVCVGVRAEVEERVYDHNITI